MEEKKEGWRKQDGSKERLELKLSKGMEKKGEVWEMGKSKGIKYIF